MDKKVQIIAILQNIAGEPVSLASDESLFASGLLDSFKLTDLVTALEDEFSIKVPDSDLTPRKFETIDRIAAYVAAKV